MRAGGSYAHNVEPPWHDVHNDRAAEASSAALLQLRHQDIVDCSDCGYTKYLSCAVCATEQCGYSATQSGRACGSCQQDCVLSPLQGTFHMALLSPLQHGFVYLLCWNNRDCCAAAPACWHDISYHHHPPNLQESCCAMLLPVRSVGKPFTPLSAYMYMRFCGLGWASVVL